MNKRADSYTWIRIDKPYIALNPDTKDPDIKVSETYKKCYERLEKSWRKDSSIYKRSF